MVRQKQGASFFQKKAFIFTFMSFFFVASVFLYVQTQQLEQQITEIDADVLRVQRVSSFVTGLEEDYLPILARASAESALHTIVNESLTYVDSVDDTSDLSDIMYRQMTRGTSAYNTYFTNFSNAPMENWHSLELWGTIPREETPCLWFERGCKHDNSVVFYPTTYIPINTCSELVEKLNTDYVADGNDLKNFSLHANITCSHNLLKPIGTFDKPFKGVFEGNGYTIKAALNSSFATLTPSGLFGVTAKPAEIRNLAFEGGVIVSRGSAGGIIGFSKGALIENVIFSGSLNSIGNSSGGLVGVAQNTTIVNSAARGLVSAPTYIVNTDFKVGGLIGESQGDVEIEDSFFDGMVDGLIGVGGLVGYHKIGSLRIKNSFAFAELEGVSDIGLIIGSSADSNAVLTSVKGFNSANESTDCGAGLGSLCELPDISRDETNEYSLDKLIVHFSELTEHIIEVPFDLTYEPEFFSVTQHDPWYVRISLLFTYTIEDDSTSWKNKSKLFEFDIPIVGLQDPLLALNGFDVVPTISRTEVLPTEWSIDTLRGDLERPNSYIYVENKNAPSYLDRLQNKTGPSEFGIELVLQPNKFGLTGTPLLEKPNVDYLMVRDWNCSEDGYELYTINNLSNEVTGYEGFKLDRNHSLAYLTSSEFLVNKTNFCT